MRNQKMVLFLLAASVIPACGGAIIDGPEEPPPSAWPVKIVQIRPDPKEGDVVKIRWTTEVPQQEGAWFMRCQDSQPENLFPPLPLAYAEAGWSETITFSAPVKTRSYSCVVVKDSRAISNILQFAP